MKKKLFFTLSTTAFFLISLSWFGCQKDANITDFTQNSIADVDAADRGASPECGGQISLAVYFLGSNGAYYQAQPAYQDWHVKIETRACPNQAWTTVLEFDDDGTNAIPPNGTWVNFSPISHDKYYRITVKNEDDINLPILISSRIKNSIEASNGFTSSLTTSIAQGETKSFDYFNFAGLWKGNCGYEWKYDCNLPGGG